MNSIATSFIVVAMLTSAAPAQTTSDNTIQVLLNEVRQLRLALERSAVVAPKIQVTLQRIQLQQDAVSRASQRLEDLRDQTSHAAMQSGETADHVKALEGLLNQESDPARRKAFDEELRMNKIRLEQQAEQQKIHAAQQQAREIELSGRLQTEQARLNELNDRLNVLERMLEPPPQPRQP